MIGVRPHGNFSGNQFYEDGNRTKKSGIPQKIEVFCPKSTLISALFPVQPPAKGLHCLRNIKGDPEQALVRTAYMLQRQQSLSDVPDDATEPSTVICKDCKSTVPIASLIPVDALHKQCPRCLYIFFFKETPASGH
jgi:hypothetical protein